MAEFYSARGWEIPPLPWTNLSPPFSASKKWRCLDGSHHIADIIHGVKFKDGEKLTERAA